MSVLLKTTKWVSINCSCLHFVTQHASFLSEMFIVSWLELQKQQLKEGVNHSFQSGWVQSFREWFWGEMELCYDIMFWFTHTSSALLSKISHKVISVERQTRLARMKIKRENFIHESPGSPSRCIHIYAIASGTVWVRDFFHILVVTSSSCLVSRYWTVYSILKQDNKEWPQQQKAKCNWNSCSQYVTLSE